MSAQTVWRSLSTECPGGIAVNSRTFGQGSMKTSFDREERVGRREARVRLAARVEGGSSPTSGTMAVTGKDLTSQDLTLCCFLEVSADDWAPALASWLGVRRRLRDDVGIPVRRELHAVDFLSGRGNPSLESSWNRSKAERLPAGLNDLDRRLSRSLDHMLVMVDGDGTDPAYIDAHRELDLRSRRVVENPWHQGSHSNQWIMIADFSA